MSLTESRYAPGDEREILRLYNGVFEENRGIQHWFWKYRDNPAGPGFIFVAKDGSRVVGHYALIPVAATIDGRSTKAALSLDTLTDPRFRGQGIFPRLAQLTYEDAAKAGVRLAYGLPNQASYPGFVHKLGWKEVFRLRQSTLVLDARSFLAAKLRSRALAEPVGSLANVAIQRLMGQGVPSRSVEVRDEHAFPAEVDDLWHELRTKVGIAIERTQRYLNWRYRQIPDARYEVATACRDGQLRGLVVTRLLDREGRKSLAIAELVSPLEEPEVTHQLLRNVVRRGRTHQVEGVVYWHSPSNRLSSWRCGDGFFVKRSRSRFIVKELVAPHAEDLTGASRWSLVMGDSDNI